MELGNYFFGNSRGEYPIIETARFEAPMYRLFEMISGDTYQVDYNDEKLFLMPYYWGECTCGYDDLENAWNEKNHHRDDCYQQLVKKEMIETGLAVEDKYGGIDPAPGVDYEKMDQKLDDVRKEWCKHFGLAYPEGCAVHCTCDYKHRWAKFVSENNHKPDCPIVLPNFWWKPTNLKIQWYKRPMRDAYMNQNLTVQQYEEIMDEVFDHIKTRKK